MQILQDKELLEFTGIQESQFLVRPSELSDKIKARLNGSNEMIGDKLPWQKTHNVVALRPSEVSIWAGINGHGKSQILGQICLWSMIRSKWLIASMEMLPEATMERMSRQAAGCSPSDMFVDRFLGWTDDRLWIYDQTDTVAADRILAVIHYAVSKYGVQHVAIDSLMKCGIDDDNYNGQKQFVDKLCWLAKTTGVHIHLVAHMRKGEREGKRPGKFDVLGSSALTNLVDNLFIVHRNKDKEEKIANKEIVADNMPDCTLTCAKQRHGEWEGPINLWFHPDSKQYTSNSDNKPAFLNLGVAI